MKSSLNYLLNSKKLFEINETKISSLIHLIKVINISYHQIKLFSFILLSLLLFNRIILPKDTFLSRIT